MELKAGAHVVDVRWMTDYLRTVLKRLVLLTKYDFG